MEIFPSHIVFSGYLTFLCMLVVVATKLYGAGGIPLE